MPAETVAGDGSHLTLLVYVAIALGTSFMCSVWEAVLLSVPLSHLQVMADKGKAAGRHLLEMRRSVEQPISAILTLNTVAHTVGAAGAGAEATLIFGSRWFGVISAVLTLLILIVSEIVPKTLGTTYRRELAGFTSGSLRVLIKLLAPIVAVLEVLTRVLRPRKSEPTVTRAELQAMARLGAEGGGLAEGESRIVENLMQLEGIRVGEIMTPRTIVTALQAGRSVGEVLDGEDQLVFSRLPVYTENLDDIQGYVLRHELLEHGRDGKRDTPLRELVRPLASLPVSGSVARALERLLAEKEHICLVLDEFGGTAGVLTLEDALETLLGREIVDETDTAEDLAAVARHRFERTHQSGERREGGGGAEVDPAP